MICLDCTSISGDGMFVSPLAAWMLVEWLEVCAHASCKGWKQR